MSASPSTPTILRITPKTSFPRESRRTKVSMPLVPTVLASIVLISEIHMEQHLETGQNFPTYNPRAYGDNFRPQK